MTDLHTQTQLSTMTETERKDIEAAKARLSPFIDNALLQLMRGSHAAMQAAGEAEIERCIGIVKSCRMKEPVPEKLQGWNGAVDLITRQLESWQVEQRKP
jgi:hypothetical protein